MYNKIKMILGLVIIMSSTGFAQGQLTQYVNPFIGTGGHGHTFPGATMPHGMVQLSPDTRLTGWDGCGGYHHDDNFIYGFSHTHLSGTGVSDYGDILLMPMSGAPSPKNTVYGSKFSHSREKASPGYYSVFLEDDKIEAEFTVTERVGLHHYKFADASDNSIILDLEHRDEVLESSLKIEDKYTVSGLRRSKAWAVNQYVYFVIKFNKSIVSSGIWNNDVLMADGIKSLATKNIKAFFKFGNAKDILVKVAISAVSVEGAKKNLQKEMPKWDLLKVRSDATKKWEENLNKIVVEGDVAKKRIFYSALYHTAIVPNINMDVDGQYRGMDNKIHEAQGFNYYSVFSLWDTYRATHPLYTIIDKERNEDYVKTFLAQYEQGGRLPVWELASNETECMIGYHSVPVIVDAYMKGARNFNAPLALKAMVHSADMNHFGLEAYKKKGVIESDDEHENVSRTLEYAYDDWCIAMFAKQLDNLEIYDRFIDRAQQYKNVFDNEQGFMKPRRNGDWLSPYEPREVNSNYTEANGWQYSFYVPQDIAGYTKLLGGKKRLEQQLDELFSAPAATTGRDQSDITGLIGQYAHGNEPSHHIAYLYNYAGRPDKTADKVKFIMDNFYKDAPDGLIGNEDCGQMSAWYVMSALGIYPVTPGSGKYDVGSPVFSKATIQSSGKKIIFEANNLSESAKYVDGIALNDEFGNITALKNYQISHDVFNKNCTIKFRMTEDLKIDELKFDDSQTTTILETGFVPLPIIDADGKSFRGTTLVKIIPSTKNSKIYYSHDGTVPSIKSQQYLQPISLTSSANFKVIEIDGNQNKSKVAEANFIKVPNDWSIKLNTSYEPIYDAGGPDGLIDGIYADKNWRRGGWQGYQNQPMDVIIDLQKVQKVSKVTASFLQDTGAWIVFPKSVVLYVSDDGVIFKKIADKNPTNGISELKVVQEKFSFSLQNVSARFIRVVAQQYGKLPDWHEGAGGDTHIFVDEIGVE